jgi:hypothetical protein
MEMIVDDPEETTSYNNVYNKVLNISDNIGNMIYEERNISTIKNKVIDYITKPITLKEPIKESPNKKMIDAINSSIRQEKKSRRLIGLSIFGIIILFIISILLYIVNYILTIVFDTIEWWFVAIIMIGVIVPLFTSIAYFIAKGDY